MERIASNRVIAERGFLYDIWLDCLLDKVNANPANSYAEVLNRALRNNAQQSDTNQSDSQDTVEAKNLARTYERCRSE